MSDKDLMTRGDVEKILCDAYDDGMIDEGELAYLISEANKIPPVPHEMSAREYIGITYRMLREDYRAWDNLVVYEENGDSEKAIMLAKRWTGEHQEEGENNE